MRKTKKGLRKFSAGFLALPNKISMVQKIVLSSSRGQGNFRGLEVSRPRPRTSKCVLEAKDVLENSTSGNNAYQLGCSANRAGQMHLVYVVDEWNNHLVCTIRVVLV